MNDLWGEIQRTEADLETALRESKKRGAKWAQAKAHYYTVKAEEAWLLKQTGESASFVALVVKGQPRVAEAMLSADAAEVEYENAKEARNVYKKKLDTLREQYAREWSQAGQVGDRVQF